MASGEYHRSQLVKFVNSKDPRTNTTNYAYSPSYEGAYLTQITYPSTNGVAHTASFGYDFASGQLTSSVDQNQQPTTYVYGDSLERLSDIHYPDNGRTSYTYDSICGHPATTTIDLTGTMSYSETATLDGLCHLTLNSTSDPEGADTTKTDYDGLGRVWHTYNPYRGSTAGAYTTYNYDALGRTTSVSYPDSNATTTSYSGSCSSGTPLTVTDAASKTRTLCSDGLGRLTSVIENPGGSPSYSTT